MRESERSGNSGRAQDTFKRIPAPRLEHDIRSPAPDDFTFLNAERRKQGLPLARNQPTLQDTRRPIQPTHSNGDTYRPPPRTSELSVSPPPLRSSQMKRRRSSCSWAPDANYRNDHYSPSRGRPPFQPGHRASSPTDGTRDYRDSRSHGSFDPHPDNDWDPREPYPLPARRMEMQPRSPTQQKPPDLSAWQSSPAKSSLSARRDDNRSPLYETFHPVPTKRRNTQLFGNISWIKPRSPPAQLVKPLVNEMAQRAGKNFSPEIEKADVNGIRNVPTGPASKGRNPPVPQFILQLPHLFIPSRSIPVLPTTTPHLAKLVQRHGPVHVVSDDTGYFIAFANSVEGRSKLHQCEKAHNDHPFFGKYRIAMKPYPLGQPQGQNPHDCQPSAKPATVETSPTTTVVGFKSLENDLVVKVRGADRCMHDEGAPELETTAKMLGEDENSRADSRPRTSHPTPANPYARPLQPPRLLKNVPAQPASPLDSTSSISGQTGSDFSGMGPRRCHVCKTRSELDTLVKCTTCSRRYHRYCHTGKSIPATSSDQWQCQRCERKNVPLRDTHPAIASQSVNSVAASPPTKESTIPNIELDGSLDHEQTAFFPAKQTEDWKQPDQIETRHQHPSPVPHASIDAVVSHQKTTAATSMASQPDPAQVQLEPPQSEDAQFTEAQDLVEKSFSITASSGPADQPSGIKKPGKLRLTKRKRTGTSEREKPCVKDASIFNLPEGEEQPSTNAPRPITHFAPSTEVDGEPEVLPQRKLSEGHTYKHDSEPKTTGTRPPVASASPAGGDLRVTKRTKGPNPRMAPCVQCGAQTTKGLSGPATCLQCKRKAATKLAEDAARQDQEKPSLQASRQGTPGANSSSVSDASARPSVEKDLPSRLMEGPVDDTVTVKAANPQQENGASHVSSRDVDRTDVVEQDNGDVEGDQDVDMMDEPDDAIASDQEEDEASLPGMLETSLLPSTLGRRKRIKRKNQRAAAMDQYDLGDSFQRPKGSYVRLAGMALFDAPANRLQTNRIVNWVSNNVPGYDQSQGTWVSGLKSTLRLNATGKVGKVIWTQVKLADGDDVEEGRYWWELKPDIKDTVDRWDYNLQRPAPGPNADPPSDRSPIDSISDDEDENNEEIQGQIRLLDSASSSRSTKRKHTDSSRRTSAKKRRDLIMDVTVRDGLINDANGTSQEADSSDEEPLASQANKKSSFRASNNQQSRTSFRSRTFDNPSKAGSKSDTNSLATLLAAPGVHPVRDDVSVRMLIQEETEDIDFSAKDLHYWPEYDPANRFNRDEKLAEIKARPSRKQLFGKPAGPLTFRSAPASASRFTVLKNAAADFESIGKELEEMEVPCDSLADFLGSRRDVTFVPCNHKGFLAYRNPHVRNPNTTDIRLHM